MALFNMLAQIILALVIFVLGYFVLLFSAIGAVLLSALAYKAGRSLWLRVNARAASAAEAAQNLEALRHG